MRTTFVLINKYDQAKQAVDWLMDKNIGKEDIKYSLLIYDSCAFIIPLFG